MLKKSKKKGKTHHHPISSSCNKMQPSAKQITPSGVRPLFRHKSSDTRSLVKDRTEELSHEDRNIQAIKLKSEAALQKTM